MRDDILSVTSDTLSLLGELNLLLFILGSSSSSLLDSSTVMATLPYFLPTVIKLFIIVVPYFYENITQLNDSHDLPAVSISILQLLVNEHLDCSSLSPSNNPLHSKSVKKINK